MARYWYRRRYYWHKSTPSKTIGFYPIIEDLKKEFFNLPARERGLFFRQYRITYGESAYNYAISSYYDWQTGYKQLASKTLLKLIAILPKFLPTNKKIILMQKLVAYHKKNIHRGTSYHRLDWENFIDQIDRIYDDLANNTYKNMDDVIKAAILPENIKSTALWLLDDDMVVAERIIKDSVVADFGRITNAAINDLLLFRKKCIELARNGDVYHDLGITLETPVSNMRVFLPAKEKTFIEKLLGFVGL